MVEGAPHTAKERSRRSTCVLWGAPLPPYIKEGGEGAAGPLGVRLEESYSHREEDSPLLPWWRRKGGPRPHPLSNLDWAGGGVRHLLWPSSLSPIWPMMPINFPGGFR